MPDILKISGRCGSRIADVNGVLKGNIQDVNNVGGFVAYSPPLDTYTGAAAAYSVRLLRTLYTGDIMRVRRASDNVEADVGFNTSDELSLTSPISNTSDAQSYTDFADFVDHTGTPTNAFVRYWYDQASTKDAGQGTAARQPKIYDATTGLITENGKPAVDFDGLFNYFDIATSLGITGSQARSTFFVLRPEATSDTSSYQTYFGLGDNTLSINSQIWDLWPEWSVRVFGGFEKYNTATINAQYLSTNILSGTNVTDNAFFLDGAEQTATSSTSTTVNTDNTVQRIGRSGSSATTGPYYTGKIQEVVIYASAQTTNRIGIECNTNGYFKIY